MSLEMARSASAAALLVRARGSDGVAKHTRVLTGGWALLEMLRRCPLLAWLYILAFLPVLGSPTRALCDWFSSDASARPGEHVGRGLALLAAMNWLLSVTLGWRGDTNHKRAVKAVKVKRGMGRTARVSLFWATQLLVALFIIFCFYWNVRSLREENVPNAAARIAEALRLDQWWGMFSPNPPFEYGWFVVSLKLSPACTRD